jgi:hypothetical protein
MVQSSRLEWPGFEQGSPEAGDLGDGAIFHKTLLYTVCNTLIVLGGLETKRPPG